MSARCKITASEEVELEWVCGCSELVAAALLWLVTVVQQQARTVTYVTNPNRLFCFF